MQYVGGCRIAAVQRRSAAQRQTLLPEKPKIGFGRARNKKRSRKKRPL